MSSSRGVLTVKPNQEHEYFICGTENGIRIFHMDPLVQTLHVDSSKIGSVRCAEMLYRTNIIVVVGGGSRPLFDDRTVVVWDTKEDCAVSKIIMSEPVLDVKLTLDRLLVVLRSKIIMLSFPKLELLSELPTQDNPNGVCAVSYGSPSHNARRLVFPSKKSKGYIQIEELDKQDTAPQSKPQRIIKAHGNDIVCLAIDSTGSLIATASMQGTNIHLYNAETKECITRLRRGIDKANIYCLSFSKDKTYLCCSSDKGTVHVWSLKDPDMNPVSTFKPLVGLPVEIKSYASFTVTAECACVCSFGLGDVIYAVCLDGSFHKYKIGRDGSQTDTGKNCVRVAHDIYPNLGELYD